MVVPIRDTPNDTRGAKTTLVKAEDLIGKTTSDTSGSASGEPGYTHSVNVIDRVERTQGTPDRESMILEVELGVTGTMWGTNRISGYLGNCLDGSHGC